MFFFLVAGQGLPCSKLESWTHDSVWVCGAQCQHHANFHKKIVWNPKVGNHSPPNFLRFRDTASMHTWRLSAVTPLQTKTGVFATTPHPPPGRLAPLGQLALEVNFQCWPPSMLAPGVDFIIKPRPSARGGGGRELELERAGVLWCGIPLRYFQKELSKTMYFWKFERGRESVMSVCGILMFLSYLFHLHRDVLFLRFQENVESPARTPSEMLPEPHTPRQGLLKRLW